MRSNVVISGSTDTRLDNRMPTLFRLARPVVQCYRSRTQVSHVHDTARYVDVAVLRTKREKRGTRYVADARCPDSKELYVA